MPSPWRLGLSLLRAPALELGFAVRSCVRWSRGDAWLADETKQDLFDFLPPAERERAETRARLLVEQFDLTALRATSTRVTFTSNLARLEAMTRLAVGQPIPVGADGIVRAADFGCGDFHYATALQRWLSRHGGGRRATVLRGIELDAHGIYRDGHSRADHARAHARLAGTGGSTVRFEIGDCTRIRLPEQDVVTLFFPFLSVYASLRWGTPLSRLRPRRLVRRAVRTVRPGGWLVVANQTAAEFAHLERLLLDQPVRRLLVAGIGSDLTAHGERTRGQIGSVWQRY